MPVALSDAAFGRKTDMAYHSALTYSLVTLDRH
jgi:hypothetical protein